MIKNPKIQENINLAQLTTMKLGGSARFFATSKTKDDVDFLLEFAKSEKLPVFVLGGGSNTLVHDEGFSGLVIKNEIMGKKIISEDDNFVEFELGAGENWDEFVRWSVFEENLSGIEAMVSIPGTVGALPVQNVGAYGQEIANVFIELEAIDLNSGKTKVFSKDDCKFGYRDSIFRRELSGKYFITSLRIKLKKSPPKGPFYSAIETYFKNKNIKTDNLTSAQILEAVAKIRSDKLPDPDIIPSAGSFFKNAIISGDKAQEIKSKYGDNLPLFDLKNGNYKISTGWLIDKSGLKGVEISGMKPHDKNALVLTNISANSFKDLASARQEIIKTVENKFDILIEQEPLEI